MRKLFLISILCFLSINCCQDGTGGWFGLNPCYSYTKDKEWIELDKLYWLADLEYERALCNEANIREEFYNDQKNPEIEKAFKKVCEAYRERDRIFWQKKVIEARYYHYSNLNMKYGSYD